MKSIEFGLQVLKCQFGVRCSDLASAELIRENYSEFLTPADDDPSPEVCYEITVADDTDHWVLRDDTSDIHCRDRYQLVYEFEKLMTERVQTLRAELFFIHGAALAQADRCVVIAGASGSGKSSLAWYMSHNGFDYLSDELAPVDPVQLLVEPYPHALCLKDSPLTEPPLPKSTQNTNATMHVPAYELPVPAGNRYCALSLVVFIEESEHGPGPDVRAISEAESAARLFSNGLNQLAHPGDGLPVARDIASRAPAYLLSGGTVEGRATAIHSLLEETAAP